MGPLAAFQVDQRVLQDLLAEKLPRLTAHLGQHRIDLSLITFNWFLVVFADSLISDILLRVWDAFLYEGTKVGLLGLSWLLTPLVLTLALEKGRQRPPGRAAGDSESVAL